MFTLSFILGSKESGHKDLKIAIATTNPHKNDEENQRPTPSVPTPQPPGVWVLLRLRDVFFLVCEIDVQPKPQTFQEAQGQRA